ncbi:aspartyl/asparaginyl beta-hydroxylase domain-containing protein [Nonomuraea angiospora]|uniref:aspartyl/asparaginyl beta-hydroxylase domain-containing protein n=1 Tax=Nonomuraea angiospora TaxID=46172 RepID=UPI0033FE45B2
MTPEIVEGFDAIKNRYGTTSIERVEAMLDSTAQQRSPWQKAAKWVMPGISQRPWHDPYEHAEIAPVVRAFEENHQAIKRELATAWSERNDAFSSYEHYLMRQDNWRALYLFRDGAPVAESARTAPTAFKVLEENVIRPGKICPLLESHFSTLLPGASVAPHCDLWNFSINLHVAIDIPDDCAIRVGGETRRWEEGSCLLFDYSFEHEAWNHGDRARTCLLIDLWHPETTIPEREALVVLVTEIRRLLV